MSRLSTFELLVVTICSFLSREIEAFLCSFPLWHEKENNNNNNNNKQKQMKDWKVTD